MKQNNLKSKFNKISTKLKINKPLNFKALFTSNIVLAVLIFCILIAVVVILSTLPFPHRTFVDFMDKQMIKDGQAAVIISMTTFVFILIPSYIALLVTSSMVAYNFFVKNPKAKENQPFNQKWYITTGLIIFCFFYILVPIIFVWFFFIPYEKWVSTSYKTITLTPVSFKNKRTIWISLITVLTLGISSIIPAIVFSMLFPIHGSVPNRKIDLESIYTLSQDKPNTMVLYFDRAYGLIWNQLLLLDYLIVHDDSIPNESKPEFSFIEKFPEFTTYLQSLSQGMVTNAANPIINGSWYQQPNFKNEDLIDPFYGENYKDETMNEWYFNSYRNSTGLFTKYGYENLNLYNIPYYGKKNHEKNANMIEWQTRMQNLWDSNTFYPIGSQLSSQSNNTKFLGIDVTEVIKAIGWDVTHTRLDYINAYKELAAYEPKQTEINTLNSQENTHNDEQFSYGTNHLMSFDGDLALPNLRSAKNWGSAFTFLHFHITHENYTYVQNKDSKNSLNPGGINYANVDNGEPIQTGPQPNNFIISMWYAIQKLKKILVYLQNLPCDREGVSNQYENTNIYIISDHGSPIVNDYSYWFKLTDYLISKGYMTETQKNYINTNLFNNPDMSFGFWNTIFMRKPAKYVNNDDWNKVQISTKLDTPSKLINNFFNKDLLYVDSDLFPLIEGDLQKQNADIQSKKQNGFVFNKEESWYWNQEEGKVRSFETNNEELQKLIATDFTSNFLIDPLNNEKMKLGNRTNVPLYMTDWLFKGNSKRYKIQYKYYFSPTSNNLGGIFNINNYKLYKKYI